MMKHLIPLLLFLSVAACTSEQGLQSGTSCRYARNFDVVEVDSIPAVVVISPYDGSRDTVEVAHPMDNIICMSTSHVACLSEIGAGSVITAVSGLKFISDTDIRSSQVQDIGYETSLDYERIMSLAPDLLVTYTVSSAEPPYLARLRTLGIPVLVVYDHLENHPLARAEYIRLFGALTGMQDKADSVFRAIADRYETLAAVAGKDAAVQVLMNIPYGDVWYVPGEENYMSRLIRDAGGAVLGAAPSSAASRTVSIEEAWELSLDADIWLNPGHCNTLDELKAEHHLFPEFGPLKKGLPVYNNTLRTTPEGGNDFWESGAVRPDLVLEDLISIFSDSSFADAEEDMPSLNYFKPLN